MVGKLLIWFAVLSGGLLAALFYQWSSYVPTLPDIPDMYWGPGTIKQDDTALWPFSINVSQPVIDDLQRRLRATQGLFPPLEGVGFEYGFNTVYLKKIVQYWLTNYKWKDREMFLNKFAQFKTQVSGLDLHFIRVKPKDSKDKKVLPLLLLHGWPGSVREFYKLIPLLTTPRAGHAFVFEVIAPSLPGYGFSQAAARPGLGVAQIAQLMRKLMLRIGHDKFYVQGGDWGSPIGANMAALYPDNVLGFHSNMCFVNNFVNSLKLYLTSFLPTVYVEEEHVDKAYPVGAKMLNLVTESGYLHIQATKPDTIGVALRDSPVGLAAYILEKFSTWTKNTWRMLPDGGLEKKFTLTELLDNIMIYWVTGSITSSVRLYSESLNLKQTALGLDNYPVAVPTACARFPDELIFMPTSFLKQKFKKLVWLSDPPRGGHFAAFEEPNLLADDIWESIAVILQQPFPT